MADQNQQVEQAARTQNSDRYYRSHISGLSIVIGYQDDGVAPVTVRFTPILHRWDGELQKFGYLKTTNKAAIKKLAEDPNVVEIKAEEYGEIMARAEDASEPNVRKVA